MVQSPTLPWAKCSEQCFIFLYFWSSIQYLLTVSDSGSHSMWLSVCQRLLRTGQIMPSGGRRGAAGCWRLTGLWISMESRRTLTCATLHNTNLSASSCPTWRPSGSLLASLVWSSKRWLRSAKHSVRTSTNENIYYIIHFY